MSKPKIFSLEIRSKTRKKGGLPKNKGTPECVNRSPQINILPRLSSPDNQKIESPSPSVTDDNRNLVKNFLNETFYGHDIHCQVFYCSICRWSISDSLPVNDSCPVCGQKLKTVSIIIERGVLSYDDTILEIKTGQ